MSKPALTYPLFAVLLSIVFILLALLSWVIFTDGNLLGLLGQYAIRLLLTGYVVAMALRIADRSYLDMGVGLNIAKLLFLWRDKRASIEGIRDVKNNIWKGFIPVDVALAAILALSGIWGL